MSLADLPLFARPSPPEVGTASLEQRLARCLPGARVRYYWSSDVAERWRVKLAGRVLSRCHSEREAIVVAIALFGGGR